MNEEELIAGLRWCLDCAKLSGADMEFCERVVQDGFPDPWMAGSEKEQDLLETELSDELGRAEGMLRNHGYRRP